MNHQEVILEKIEEAMRSACRQTELFTDAIAEPIAAEYLFTVEVAKAIAELNGPAGFPYVIRVERDAETFATDCLRPFLRSDKGKFGGNMIFRRSKPDVGRKGRIDVTVYIDKPNSGYWGHQPLCAIEVKGFNPAKDLVIKDLMRNACFLSATGDTGHSVLEFSAFAAFHLYKRTDDAQVIAREQHLRKMYEGYIGELEGMSNINSEIRVVRVSLEQYGEVIHGVDYDEIDFSRKHHIAGAIVLMTRLPAPIAP